MAEGRPRCSGLAWPGGIRRGDGGGIRGELGLLRVPQRPISRSSSVVAASQGRRGGLESRMIIWKVVAAFSVVLIAAELLDHWSICQNTRYRVCPSCLRLDVRHHQNIFPARQPRVSTEINADFARG